MLSDADGNFISNVSFHHNLVALGKDRNPRVKNIKQAEIVNNLIYGWGGTPSRVDGMITANWVNNYYKPLASSSSRDLKFDDTLDYSVAKFYVQGNYADAATNRTYNTANSVRDPASDPHAIILQQNNGDITKWYTATPPVFKSNNPVATLTFTPDSTADIYEKILTYGGAPQRDAVNTRIVNHVRNRDGQLITATSAVGGWPAIASYTVKTDSDNDGMPNVWEQQYGLNPSVNDSSADPDNDGYTNIEEYINSLITIPGYTSGPPTVAASPSPTPLPSPSPSPTPSPSASPTPCQQADINQSGQVDIWDYSDLAKNFFSRNPDPPRADIHKDGVVDIWDYSILASQFFERC